MLVYKSTSRETSFLVLILDGQSSRDATLKEMSMHFRQAKMNTVRD